MRRMIAFIGAVGLLFTASPSAAGDLPHASGALRTTFPGTSDLERTSFVVFDGGTTDWGTVTFWYGAFSTGTLSYTAEVTDVVVSGSMVRFMHRVPAGNEPASNVYVVTEVTDNGPGSADEIAWAFHWDENVARPWFTNGLDPQVPSHTIVSGNAVVTD